MRRFRSCVLTLPFWLLLVSGPWASAQWAKEGYSLEAGWTAIWLPVDATHAPVDTILAGQPNIEEIWRWNPLASSAQFTESPSVPIQPDVQWTVWRRGFPADSTLGTLTANAAYLIKVADGVPPFTWELVGKPVAPRYNWKTSGLNFVGFPMVTPDSAISRNFERFFGYSSVLKSNPPVFTYVGGPLSDSAPKNPAPVTAPRTTAVSRGKAYWVQSTQYTDYHGPLRVTVLGSGLDYGESGVTKTVRIKNVIDPVRNETVTVTLTPLSSETPPAGQVPLAGIVPLQVRDPLNLTTGQFTFSDFTGPVTRSLAPGQEIEVVLAVNRSAMGNAAGDTFQSLLQITDSLNLTRMVLPVRAVTTSLAGLWVGAAIVTTVDLIVGQTNTPAEAPASFPIRLIVYRDASGAATLLQQVYVGSLSDVPTVFTKAGVDANADAITKIRLSSSAFPLDLSQLGVGTMNLSGPVTFDVTLGQNAPTNPFLHRYHPDHDNLDTQFLPILSAPYESYAVSRSITLSFESSLTGISDSEPTWGSTTLGGAYSETVSGLRSRDFDVSGTFVLRRVSAAAVLVNP